MKFEDFVKECESCRALLPMTAKFCEFCNFEFKDRVLNDIELKIPLQQIVSEINRAFLKLERFMDGLETEYHSFDFKEYFDLLFAKAKLLEIFTPQTRALIDQYWNLTEQFRIDIDKGNYDNNDAHENDDFANDIDAILRINNDSHKFIELSTEEDLDEFDRRFSIRDIIESDVLNKEQAIEDINITGLSLRKIALLYYFKGVQITRGEVANSIAAQYNHKSGDKLYQLYTFYSDRRHRIKMMEGSVVETTYEKKIALFEEVIDLLKHNLKAQLKAMGELTLLKADA